ncbi:hypothetical protein [Spirosoma koreense]
MAPQAPCPTDFHGVKAASFQACFDYYAALNYWPETLSGGNTLAGSFQPGPERPVRTNMSEADFIQRRNEWAAQQVYPHQVSAVGGGYDVGTKDLFGLIPIDTTSTYIPPLITCIWKPVAEPAETHVMTVADFVVKNQAMADMGYVLHDLCGYSKDASSAGIRLVGTWRKRPHGGFTQYVNMTRDQAKGHFQELTPKGYQITRFCGYWVNGKTYYAAIYEQTSGEWYHYFDMSSDQYQAKYNELAPRKLPIRHLSRYGDRYSVIWGHPL